MDKHIELTHQAIAVYSARNFEEAIVLLQKAFSNLKFSNLKFSNATYNAIADALEMVELLFEHLTILERNQMTDLILQALKGSLMDLAKVNLETFSEQLGRFTSLLDGLQVGFNFFNQQQISLLETEPMISFDLVEADQIQLFKWRNDSEVMKLVEAFNNSFAPQTKSLEACRQAIEEALEKEDKAAAEELLLYMIERYPKSKQQAFLNLGHLYFKDKAYQKATEAYMKTIVMGTSKEEIKTEIQTACNALAAAAKTSKEASRWRELLINFFG